MALQDGQIAKTQVEDLVTDLADLNSAVALKANSADLTAHTGNTSNPHGVTAAQAGAIPTSLKGAINGVAELDANGKVPSSQLPALALERLTTVADQAARFALTTAEVQDGDIVKQTDTLTTYVVTDDSQLNSAAGYTVIASPTAAPVDSVFGRIGAVTAVSGDYNSDQVTNASSVSGASVSDALETLSADIAAAIPAYNYLYLIPAGTVNGVNTDFTPRNAANIANVAVNPDETDVYLNNLWQEPGVQYTWETGNTILRFVNAPIGGYRVRVRGKQA